MTSVHGTPEPDGSENGDPVPQLEVWATLNKTVQVTTSNRTRNTTKTVKSTDTRVIFVPIEDLTFGGFMSVVLADFKFSTEMPEGSTLPFTYYHKGRPKANAASVESDKDFDTMIRVLDSKQLKLVNIGFEDSDVKKALGNAPISGVNDTGSSGLAEHNGIPNVTVMSQLERQRATITQKLEDKWRCLDHSGACYVKDKIHERLTPFRLSIWSNHIRTVETFVDTHQSPSDVSFYAVAARGATSLACERRGKKTKTRQRKNVMTYHDSHRNHPVGKPPHGRPIKKRHKADAKSLRDPTEPIRGHLRDHLGLGPYPKTSKDPKIIRPIRSTEVHPTRPEESPKILKAPKQALRP
ncbi:hypothetical protein RhiJN_16259 [Ceratobasidium sp. AG-Ba]|nr:hypothetical protein RhiJN_16259 [Ceratobasidium sp. AG-Ba]